MKYLIMKIKSVNSYGKPLIKMLFEAQDISCDFAEIEGGGTTYSLYNVKIKDIVSHENTIGYVAVEDSHLRLYSFLSRKPKTEPDVHPGDQYDKLIHEIPKMLLDTGVTSIKIFDNEESAQLYYESED